MQVLAAFATLPVVDHPRPVVRAGSGGMPIFFLLTFFTTPRVVARVRLHRYVPARSAREEDAHVRAVFFSHPSSATPLCSSRIQPIASPSLAHYHYKLVHLVLADIAQQRDWTKTKRKNTHSLVRYEKNERFRYGKIESNTRLDSP